MTGFETELKQECERLHRELEMVPDQYGMTGMILRERLSQTQKLLNMYLYHKERSKE